MARDALEEGERLMEVTISLKGKDASLIIDH
jgi:hypothetical protein